VKGPIEDSVDSLNVRMYILRCASHLSALHPPCTRRLLVTPASKSNSSFVPPVPASLLWNDSTPCEEHVRSGWRALDALLPWGGFPRGALVEWLGAEGGGVGLLALLAAREAMADPVPLVIIDPRRQFYPPAAAAWGFQGEDLFLVHPANVRETLWALDQVLRCRGVSAVWASLDDLAPRPFRRLQLAAEEGGAMGCLVRPLRVQGRPSWAEVQLIVRPLPPRFPNEAPAKTTRQLMPLSGRRWRIELTRYRGAKRSGSGTGVIELELDEQGHEISNQTQEMPRHATDSLPLVSPLASSANPRCQARA